MSKEFVLVSQGIEIMRTKLQEVAINEVKKANDEWYEYKQRCEDNYEDYADNYVELFIEDDDSKLIEQLKLENQQLKEKLRFNEKTRRKQQRYWGKTKFKLDKVFSRLTLMLMDDEVTKAEALIAIKDILTSEEEK